MPDFSSVDSTGVATLINPQYVASVKHNGGYQNVVFGKKSNSPDYDHYNYKIVDRNNHSRLDFHAPRLNKLVTETAPSALTELAKNLKTPEDLSQFDRLLKKLSVEAALNAE
ncbi:hypothetical protein H5U71_23325, partial [Escherichia coli]|nr:hypothetical protein [Escherichia coli]